MSDNLKQCPFCGRPGFVTQIGPHRYKAMCDSQCCIVMPSGIESAFTSKDNAIWAWNNRANNKVSCEWVNCRFNVFDEVGGNCTKNKIHIYLDKDGAKCLQKDIDEGKFPR